MESKSSDHARTVWSMKLNSGIRAAFACAIIGCTTLYGPKCLRDQIKFPAFSYVTVILIVYDATLGDTLRGCWHAFCATAQVVPLAVAGRWLFDPAGLPLGVVALVAAVASFLVVLPESTHQTAKRIALGQIVLVCTEAVIRSDKTGFGFMHPLHIAASTALGVLASVLALLLPFPELAHHKVQKLCRLYAENASERMSLYSRAFNADNYQAKTELLLKAKPIAETGTKILQCVGNLQEGIRWERPWSRFYNHDLVGLGETLQSMELTMRGVESSLVSSLAYPIQPDDQEQLSSFLHGLSGQLQQKIEQLLPFCAMESPEKRGGFVEKKLSLPLDSIVPIHKLEWICFFFSCIDILLNYNVNSHASPKNFETQPEKEESSIIRAMKTWIDNLTNSERLESAFKCSIAIGLSLLFGLMLERENGCWASLTVAISFSTGRQPIFTIANTRAQGTAIGSVYGVICCFLFHYAELRLLALLPWIIFTSFLMHSKMYGQTGGISAAIGASLLLGRMKYGPPSEFAIARITAVFVGLCCFLLVELLLQPTRAATLAKRHLHRTIHSLQDCLNETRSCSRHRNLGVSKVLQVREKQRNLESLVQEFRKSVADADSEPDFWCLPFQTSCYHKLIGSFSDIVNMLYFLAQNIKIMSEYPESGALKEQLDNEVELLQESVNSLLKYLEKTSLTKTAAEPTEEKLRDLEEGKLQNPERLNALVREDEEAESTTEREDEKRLGEMMVRCIGAIGFCLSSLRKDIDEVEIYVKEIVQWENQSLKPVKI